MLAAYFHSLVRQQTEDMNPDELRAWQRRLTEAFDITDGSNATLRMLSDVEARFGDYVAQNYAGHRALWASFMTFFMETLDRAARSYAAFDTAKRAPHHPTVFVDAVTHFRSFRAADALLYAGYPLDGYALLRDLKDEAVFLGALSSGSTNYRRLRGFGQDAALPERSIQTRLRKKEESRLLHEFFSDSGGVDAILAAEARRWSDSFHREVHGSRFTAVDVSRWFLDGNPLEFAPVPRRETIGPYVSAFPVVGWMFLRCLPFLQLPGKRFDEDWERDWRLLDTSFRWMLSTWDESRAPTGTALTSLIEVRLPFDPTIEYFEPPPAA